MCWKCGKMWWGVLVLILGVLLLLRDIGIWTFWGIQPWTLIFLLFGLGASSTSICKCETKKKK
ncbi:MAG: hypothetical protein KJ922_01295 [Nanoarchaeota archaeon]|nr:hypothetical protein [Nanoarchaeota archaeon]MBU1703980.1 hypothetical protein [Nanoarchaeota archaeon]